MLRMPRINICLGIRSGNEGIKINPGSAADGRPGLKILIANSKHFIIIGYEFIIPAGAGISTFSPERGLLELH